MNRHQSEENADDADVIESFGFQQPGHAVGSRVIPDRFGDIPVRVGIAVEHETEQRAHSWEIREVRSADDPVWRAVEVERQQPSTRDKHAVNFPDRHVQMWDVPQSIARRDDLEVSSAEGQRQHISDEKRRADAAQSILIAIPNIRIGMIPSLRSDSRWELRVGSNRGCPPSRVGQLNHPVRQIQSHGSRGPVAARLGEDVASAAREIEDAVRGTDPGQPDQSPLPPAVLPVRQKPGDEIVPIRDGGEQLADVALFAFGRRDRAAE